MRKFIIKCLGIACVSLSFNNTIAAKEVEKKDLTIDLAYYAYNNEAPYIVATAKTKDGRKFIPVSDINVKFFLEKDSAGNMLGQLGSFKTNEQGKAIAIVTPAMKDIWTAKENHSFYASTTDSKAYNAADAELEVGEAKIAIDTGDDKAINIKVTQLVNHQWVPVKDADVKIGIQRLNSYLPAGEEPNFTTDSLGAATATFNKIGIPGDKNGLITLVARLDDNDQFGNVSALKTVPWGKAFVYKSNFNARTLWSTRMKTPIWLLFMAYSIIIAVWGTLIYLVALLFKIKKLGKEDIAH